MGELLFYTQEVAGSSPVPPTPFPLCYTLFMAQRPVDMTNKAAVDAFSLVHFGVGAAAGALGLSWPEVFLGALVFEVLERDLKEHHPQWFPSPSQDSMANSTTDIGVTTLGGYVGAKYMRRRKTRRRKKK